eukprot:1327596-Pyramimonas_sp.AAC.1
MVEIRMRSCQPCCSAGHTTGVLSGDEHDTCIGSARFVLCTGLDVMLWTACGAGLDWFDGTVRWTTACWICLRTVSPSPSKKKTWCVWSYVEGLASNKHVNRNRTHILLKKHDAHAYRQVAVLTANTSCYTGFVTGVLFY